MLTVKTEEISLLIAGIGFMVALYGAILATYLAKAQRDKEKRAFKTIFEFIEHKMAAQLLITNSGYRPVSITRVIIYFYEEREGERDSIKAVPQEFLYAKESKNSLPVLLSEGEQVSLQLSDVVAAEYLKTRRIRVNVKDSEGKTYVGHEERFFNSERGLYYYPKGRAE